MLLVGLSGSGKTTVGRLLAERLGYSFLDLDAEAERLAGQTVSELFSGQGEAGFRRWEAEASRIARSREQVVVATGGGWMARLDVERNWPDTLRVWLKVSPAVAVRRIARDPLSRPLLSETPEDGLREQAIRREPAYREAELAVDTDDRTPSDVAERIQEMIERVDT